MLLCEICGLDVNREGEYDCSLVSGMPVCKSCAKTMTDEEWDKLRRKADGEDLNPPCFEVKGYFGNVVDGADERGIRVLGYTEHVLFKYGEPVLVFKHQRNAELVKEICMADAGDGYHPACFAYKLVTESTFTFIYGKVIVGHRLHVNRPIIHDKLVLDKCIRMGIQHKVRNMAGDDYYEVQILYKDDNGKVQCGKYDLEYYDVTIEFQGDMQIHL